MIGSHFDGSVLPYPLFRLEIGMDDIHPRLNRLGRMAVDCAQIAVDYESIDKHHRRLRTMADVSCMWWAVELVL